MGDVPAFLMVAGVHAAVVFLFLFWVMPRFFKWLLGLEESIQQEEERVQRIQREIDENTFTEQVLGLWTLARLHSVRERREQRGSEDDTNHRHA